MSNSLSSLDELVCLNVWGETPEKSENQLSVFADLAFRNGYFGQDDAGSEYTFTASLRRAKITVSAEKPLQIDPKTVLRMDSHTNIEIDLYRRVRSEATMGVGASAAVDTNKFFGLLSAILRKERSNEQHDEARLKSTVPPLLLRVQPGDGHYSWEVVPTFAPFVEGAPWGTIEKPLLAVDGSKKIRSERAVKLEISCRKEDLKIQDIVAKSGLKNSSILSFGNSETKRVAAEQYIRDRLFEENLQPGLMDSRYSEVVLASSLVI